MDLNRQSCQPPASTAPYVHDGRRYVVIHHPDRTTSMSYPRFLMQEHLGRELDPVSETVDHVDENPLNDVLSNFQLLTLSDNARKAAAAQGRVVEMVSFICPMCDEPATKVARFVRHNRNQGKPGPFCGRRCAATHSWLIRKTSTNGGTGDTSV